MHVPLPYFKPFHTAISDGPCIVVRISMQITLSVVILLAAMLSFECYMYLICQNFTNN